VRGEARERALATAGVAIRASDRDAGAVEAATENAARAGVGDDIAVACHAVSDLPELPDGSPAGWMVTNPPYGKRVAGRGDLRNLYARLGDVARVVLPGWGVALLAADDRLARHTGLPLTPALATTNGGVPVHLLTAPP
jgi:putative N6-adenine-specific DNA methylase